MENVHQLGLKLGVDLFSVMRTGKCPFFADVDFNAAFTTIVETNENADLFFQTNGDILISSSIVNVSFGCLISILSNRAIQNAWRCFRKKRGEARGGRA